MDIDNFENVINQYNLKSNFWWPLINEVVENDEFIELLEPELYEKVLLLQLWLSDHQHDIIEGSMLYFLMQKKKK